MRVLWLGGTHPRHLYYINEVRSQFPVCAAIVERREQMIPDPPPGIGDHDRGNFVRHFANRDQAEKRFFGDQSMPDCPRLDVEPAGLNSPESLEFIRAANADAVLIFGCGLVKEPLFSALPRATLNLHLGLSPRYRGAATLFWPFYFLEPTFAGATFHRIVSEPDAGPIVHQTVPKLDPADTIHDVACKTVMSSALDAIELLKLYEKRGEWQARPQKATGKKFLVGDFRPEHLRVIYDLYQDDIVKHHLQGNLRCGLPKLVRQF